MGACGSRSSTGVGQPLHGASRRGCLGLLACLGGAGHRWKGASSVRYNGSSMADVNKCDETGYFVYSFEPGLSCNLARARIFARLDLDAGLGD